MVATGEFFDAEGRRDGRGDQGADRDARSARGRRRRRRHHLQGLPRRNRLSQDEGRLLRLPLFDRDAEARNRKSSQTLPAGRSGGGAGRGLNASPTARVGGCSIGWFVPRRVVGLYRVLDRDGARRQGGRRARKRLFSALALPAAGDWDLPDLGASRSPRPPRRPLRAVAPVAVQLGAGADLRRHRLRRLGADVLGGNWSSDVTLKRDHELVVDGPYAFVRHPIYTGILLALLGTALAVGEWRALLGVLLVRRTPTGASSRSRRP